jgi:hypothetical protein
MQRDELLPPPRWGDHGSVNRHLTAGGTVEGIPRENPYREYYLQLIKKNMEKKCTCGDTETQHYENTDKCLVCGCKEFEEPFTEALGKPDTELRQEIIKTLKAIQDYCNR